MGNGDNENGTEILDFEYWFPVDTSTSTTTARQYAPMSEANAGWDAARPSREEAKYACLDSGQGCGGGTTEHSLSGDWTATTESSGSFSGYTVKDWNLNMNAQSSGHNGNHLLNANNNGANSGSGTGTNSLLALGKNDGGATKNLSLIHI